MTTSSSVLDQPRPQCQGCKKFPDELTEYVELAAEDGTTPDEYVRIGEGTFNATNGHFLCDMCYIVAGQPSGPGPLRWVCP